MPFLSRRCKARSTASRLARREKSLGAKAHPCRGRTSSQTCHFQCFAWRQTTLPVRKKHPLFLAKSSRKSKSATGWRAVRCGLVTLPVGQSLLPADTASSGMQTSIRRFGCSWVVFWTEGNLQSASRQFPTHENPRDLARENSYSAHGQPPRRLNSRSSTAISVRRASSSNFARCRRQSCRWANRSGNLAWNHSRNSTGWPWAHSI